MACHRQLAHFLIIKGADHLQCLLIQMYYCAPSSIKKQTGFKPVYFLSGGDKTNRSVQDY